MSKKFPCLQHQLSEKSRFSKKKIIEKNSMEGNEKNQLRKQKQKSSTKLLLHIFFKKQLIVEQKLLYVGVIAFLSPIFLHYFWFYMAYFTQIPFPILFLVKSQSCKEKTLLIYKWSNIFAGLTLLVALRQHVPKIIDICKGTIVFDKEPNLNLLNKKGRIKYLNIQITEYWFWLYGEFCLT